MKLLLLWHLHQPMYKDYASGRVLLPWAYLHATKDYREMAELVAQFERVKVTFNMTPSLIEMIQDYANGDPDDQWLHLLRKPPERMSEGEKQFVLDNFFSVHAERFIEPHARYQELFLKRERHHEFSPADLQDLQVLFQLAWLGESVKRHHPATKELVEKTSRYTAEDQQTLLEETQQVLKTTLSIYKELSDAGRVELSVTPGHHPILPLLCDSRIAKESAADTLLPESPFSHPEDARWQTAWAVACFAETFGKEPAGFWPAEGAVSDEALTILAEYGGRWAASDEAVLRRSVIQSNAGDDPSVVDVHRPYRYQVANKEITLFFRDHTLSDLIGFVYQRWDEQKAVEDFIARLRAIHESRPDAVVSVILDGENAWERYAANGYDFLQLLYQRLERADWIEMTTFSACLEADTAFGRLSRLHPGSWIDANFHTWIGDEEKNRAWTYLQHARQAVASWEFADNDEAAHTSPGPLAFHPRLPELARNSLLAAEASDWFWWLGPPHSSGQDPVFDLIFRTHLKNVYTGLELAWPAYLDTPVGTDRRALKRHPVAFMTPVIDGEDSDYFEWLPAGLLKLDAQGTMHRVGSRLSELYFGFDREHLYLRVDFDRPAREALTAGTLRIELRSLSRNVGINVRPGKTKPNLACGDVVEVKVPFQELGLTFCQSFDVVLTFTDKYGTERFPQSGGVTLTVPAEDLEAENWMV